MWVVGRSCLEYFALAWGWVRRLCGRLLKRFRDEVSSADVGSVSNMLRICMFMFSFEHVCSRMFYTIAFRNDASRHDSCVAPPTWWSCQYPCAWLEDYAMHVSTYTFTWYHCEYHIKKL